MRVQPRRELPRVCFRYEGTFVGSPDWWRRFEYLAERDRGLEYEEDLWTPGVFEVSIDDRPRWLVASVDRLPAGEPEALLEAARAAILAEDPGPAAPLLRRRLIDRGRGLPRRPRAPPGRARRLPVVRGVGPRHPGRPAGPLPRPRQGRRRAARCCAA